ncbi:MAG: hypothetical protein Q9224_005709 [Gallowayella concinna]
MSMTSDHQQPAADMAAQASIIPSTYTNTPSPSTEAVAIGPIIPSDAAPTSAPRLLPNHRTSNETTSDGTQTIPPPTPTPALSKNVPLIQDVVRPDSAYGGSGGTPSVSSAESVEIVEPPAYNVTAPSNPLLQSYPQPAQPAQPPRLPQPPQQQQFQQPQESQHLQYNQQYHPQDNTQFQPQPTDAITPTIDDSSSSYADSAYDDAASINESITDTLESAYSRYRWENGRRYHSYRDGAYWGPNDETHNDQQDIAHHAWRLALNNQLYLAPVHKPDRILDVGTGTGIWAIEMAETFPDAQVVGTDLSPIQPTWVPPNCIFEVDDVTMEWTFRKDSFDFIHSREMFGSIADWDEYFRQCFLHLKPGGYVEALERGVKPVSDDGTVGPDHFWTTWGNTVLSVGEMWGKGFNAWEILKERMEAAGFVDVVQVPMKWPIGPWMQDEHMKQLGMWNALRLDTGLEGYVMRLFTMAGGVSKIRLFESGNVGKTADVVL